ncbi:hypothetical protein ACER0C_005759 [Sarotherodon galilaeus]
MQAVGDFLIVFNIETSKISVTLFLIFLGLLYWYSVRPFSVLSRCGIKHPKPVPFFGNLFMFQQVRYSVTKEDQNYLQHLLHFASNWDGVLVLTFVYYLGQTPVIVVADPDILRQVLVKDFSNFPNRNTFVFAKKPVSDCLLQLRNEQWKRVRSVLTPSFSASKMKEVDSQNNPGDPLVQHAQMAFINDFFKPVLLLFCEQGDFLQLILDARATEESVPLEHFDTSNDTDEIGGNNQETQPSGSMMTEDEIVGQAFVFLLAGYETSSNTLAFTCYLLALHPERQLKVQKEVDDFYTRHDSPDYTNVQELKYLDMVICEALRLYPPGFREIDHDCVVNGQQLPKGAILEIPAGFLHYDPEHWPEPEKFIPERFTPEAKASRHPFVYIPFGAGPRNCVEMRLAQLEIKLALMHLFHNFNITACSRTEVPLELKSLSTLGPKNGVCVKISRRSK